MYTCTRGKCTLIYLELQYILFIIIIQMVRTGVANQVVENALYYYITLIYVTDCDIHTTRRVDWPGSINGPVMVRPGDELENNPFSKD